MSVPLHILSNFLAKIMIIGFSEVPTMRSSAPAEARFTSRFLVFLHVEWRETLSHDLSPIALLL